MSKTGAVEQPADDRTPRTTLVPPPRPSASADAALTAPPDSRLDAFFIPDFCAPRMVFAVVLIAELVAVTLALARADAPFLTELARISMFLQWLGLTNAALLCYSRRWLARLTVAQSSVAVFAADPAQYGADLGARALAWPGIRRRGHHRAAVRSLAVPAAQRRHRRHRRRHCCCATSSYSSMAEARARRSAVAHSSAASAHPAALPVQQHEHDRGADAQRSEARRGSRRGSRGRVSRHAARLGGAAAAEGGARAHAHLPAHRSASARRPARRDAGTSAPCR